jgi:hypothetical protein
MKRFVCSLLLFFLINNNGLSQNVDKLYILQKNDAGCLFFIHQQKLTVEKNRLAKKDLTFDITLFCQNDSATLRFTYLTNELFTADSLTIYTENESETFSVKSLYVEKKKGIWHQRIEMTMLSLSLERMYAQEVPYTLNLSKEDSDTSISYRYSKKKWNKKKAIMKDLLLLFFFNRE